jgi:hypothetical protein
MLGNNKDGPKLKLTMLLDFHFVPGLQLEMDDQHPDWNYWSMDLPNLIEKFRVDYTAEVGKRCRMEVLWKAESTKDAFVDHRGRIQERGWEILKAEEAERPRTHPLAQAEYGSIPTMRFILRSKELTVLLMAEDPSPYSWLRY